MVQEMLKRYDIVALQNHPANVTQDHTTICGFFTTEKQFADHAEYLAGRIERRVEDREAAQ